MVNSKLDPMLSRFREKIRPFVRGKPHSLCLTIKLFLNRYYDGRRVNLPYRFA